AGSCGAARVELNQPNQSFAQASAKENCGPVPAVRVGRTGNCSLSAWAKSTETSSHTTVCPCTRKVSVALDTLCSWLRRATQIDREVVWSRRATVVRCSHCARSPGSLGIGCQCGSDSVYH